MAINSLNELWLHDLGDIYDAEHRFLQAMQQMQQQAQSGAVQTTLERHIQQTQQQIGNLEQIFKLAGQSPKRVTCEAAAGIVSEGQKSLKEVMGAPQLIDVVIGCACSKVEHYEIASYRALIQGAQLMGQPQVLQLLQQNLQQEEQTAMLVEQSLPQLLQQAQGQSRAR